MSPYYYSLHFCVTTSHVTVPWDLLDAIADEENQ